VVAGAARVLPGKYGPDFRRTTRTRAGRAYAVVVTEAAAGYPPTRRRWRPPPLVGDVLVAAVMTVVTLIGSTGESHPSQPTDRGVNGHLVPAAPWPAYLLVGAAAVVLLWRRRYPVPVLAVSVACVAAYGALGYENGAALLAPLVALYAASVALPVRRAVLVAVAAFVVLAVPTAVANPFGPFGGAFVLLPELVAVALLAGLAVGNRRAYIVALATRAELAERTREDEARRRVDAERLRIARELHDVVAHTMATINVQAGVAAHVVPDLPEAAATALRAIK
jgi:Histidine kinase